MFSRSMSAWVALAGPVKQKMSLLEPELGRLMDATPPWVEDPLQR